MYEAIQNAETTGVFQIESRAQMQMLPRTLPENLDDLTVQVALVRPGPIQGGAVHPYLDRKARLREDPDYDIPYEHPSLEPILSDTLGAIVFQDQVIQVAMALAGFTAGEAEGLRQGDEPQALGRGDGRLRGALRRGRDGARASSARSPSGCSSRCAASRASAFRSRTRRRSASSPTSRPGFACTAGRSSSARS